ncbi:MAG TPA: hypothetical protein VMB51_16755 [Solirubrobacteraceae bacterium]|nr:hypothetical protein [Solirubrobacteraceae bacterium]
MSPEQPTVGDAQIGKTGLAQETLRGPAADERFEEHDDWLEEPDELPRRPRRRLLTPLPLSLLGVLLVACGFIGGVLIEKGQGSSTSAGGAGAAGLASRFAALRGGSGTAAGSGASSSSTGASGAGSSGAGSSGAARSGAGGFAGALAGGGATAGQVAFVSGSTLYVTTAEGNTVKVKTSPGSTVTKTVTASVSGIHPGETVVVTGANTNGTISAESIRVGAGGGLGGIGALFGGSGRSARGSGSGSAGSGGEPALFGEGK